MENIDEILERGVVNVIPGKEKLKELLKSGHSINVYLGIDPTATKIHIGHAVPLRKLQAFVEAGHNVIFLIGDFTALIGDTSDKEGERPILTTEQIGNNFETYKDQASKILDFAKVDVVFNSEWLRNLKFEDIVKLCQNFSVGDFVGRDLIKKRLSEGKKVGLHETLYPVMQGYDSFHMDTDLQIGGADQTFNMQAGRTLLKNLADKESFVLVTDYLIGTDGKKMSKTGGNAIWITDSPNEMYGKVMNLKDDIIEQYFLLATNVPMDKVAEIKKRLADGENPMEIKKELAKTLITELHSAEDAEKAEGHFKKTFQEKSPHFSKEIKSQETLAATIADEVGSVSEAKRLVKQGAVDVNGEVVGDSNHKVSEGDEIQIGKKIFVKVK